MDGQLVTTNSANAHQQAQKIDGFKLDLNKAATKALTASYAAFAKYAITSALEGVGIDDDIKETIQRRIDELNVEIASVKKKRHSGHRAKRTPTADATPGIKALTNGEHDATASADSDADSNASGEQKRTQAKKEKAPPLPFIHNDYKCRAIRYNRGLFTQCRNDPAQNADGFCAHCATDDDRCGTVEQRMAVPPMEFKDNKGRSPIAFLAVLRQHPSATEEEVRAYLTKKGIQIDDVHWAEPPPKKKAGRPRKAVVRFDIAKNTTHSEPEQDISDFKPQTESPTHTEPEQELFSNEEIEHAMKQHTHTTAEAEITTTQTDAATTSTEAENIDENHPTVKQTFKGFKLNGICYCRDTFTNIVYQGKANSKHKTMVGTYDPDTREVSFYEDDSDEEEEFDM